MKIIKNPLTSWMAALVGISFRFTARTVAVAIDFVAILSLSSVSYSHRNNFVSHSRSRIFTFNSRFVLIRITTSRIKLCKVSAPRAEPKVKTRQISPENRVIKMKSRHDGRIKIFQS